MFGHPIHIMKTSGADVTFALNAVAWSANLKHDLVNVQSEHASDGYR
jgi:hypothetical protein